MHHVFLGIGGNLGNKRNNFKKVYKLIEYKLGKIIEKSSVYETPPWGFQAEENFWNQIVKLETKLFPDDLLSGIRKIEGSFERKRHKEQYLSREMDIDILFYDNLVWKKNNLIIPHPRLHLRLFVLVPMAEIAADFKHPLLKMTIKCLIEYCEDASEIKKVDDHLL